MKGPTWVSAAPNHILGLLGQGSSTGIRRLMLPEFSRAGKSTPYCERLRVYPAENK